MKSSVAVFIGGALASLLRYFVNLHGGTAGFPWPTFIENASGSLLLGLLTGFFAARAKKPLVQLCLGTGFCGGYTTMSAFSKETVFLLQSAAPHIGVLYLIVSACLWGVLRIFGHHDRQKDERSVRERKGAVSIMMAVGFMIAGGFGSVLRFWLGNMLMAMFPRPRIPVSVMVVNIVGSFALGIFVSLGIDNQTVSILVGTGFFGGFTTFSTFSVEAVQLLAAKRIKDSAVYMLLTMACSLGGFWAGSMLIL
jgi:CrcB protein